MKKKFIFASYFSICLLANTICNGNPIYLNENLSKQNAININALSDEFDYKYSSMNDTLTNLGNLYINHDYYSNRYWSGIMENYLHYIPRKITKYHGCYAHTPFIGKTALANGSASYTLNQSYYYEFITSKTVYFQTSVRYEMEASVYANVGYSDEIGNLSGEIKATSCKGFEYVETNHYSSKTRVSKTLNQQIKLDQNEAKYCPDGYSMAIGWVGNFYTISYDVENVVCTWFGDQGDGLKQESVTLVDESLLSLCYVFLPVGGSFSSIWYLV